MSTTGLHSRDAGIGSLLADRQHDLMADLRGLESGTGFRLKTSSSITSNTTLGPSDFSADVDATAGAVTLTLPAASKYYGKVYMISKRDASANAVNIAADGVDTINGSATASIAFQYNSFILQSDGVSEWRVR
jgi:hypothetical protein